MTIFKKVIITEYKLGDGPEMDKRIVSELFFLGVKILRWVKIKISTQSFLP